MGMKLHAVFLDAGLPAPSMRLEGVIGGGPDFVGNEALAGVVRSLLPVMEKTGIATMQEVDIDTLADRLRDEAARSRATFVMPEIISAWARKR
jgi:hypothetical protein